MKAILILVFTLLTGCAMTQEQARIRAQTMSNSELCMAQIKYPRYTQVVLDELSNRKHSCDWQAVRFRLQAEHAQDVQNTAAITAAAQLLQMSAPHPYTLAPAPAPAQPPAWSPTGFLQSQSVNGTLRYCRYSNGVVTTISSVSMCPMNTN